MRAFLLISAMAVSSCASQPVTPPVLPDVVRQEQSHLELFVAYRISSDVRHQAAAMRKANRLVPAFEAHINMLADLADAGLNRARDYYFDGLDQESAKAIERANKALTEAQLILQHEVKPKR